MWLPTFDIHKNFFDPEFDADGNPYGIRRYRELVEECLFISKKTSTSYSEVLMMTPTEKNIIINFLVKEAEMIQKQTEDILGKRGDY